LEELAGATEDFRIKLWLAYFAVNQIYGVRF
jgi:hypothetical protein